ncbi:MAG: hypothetical protein AB8B79_17140 [Granulosicoccus sp.]
MRNRPKLLTDALDPELGVNPPVIVLLLCLLTLFFVLLFPGHPDFDFAKQFLRIPIELPVMVILLIAVKQRFVAFLCVILVAGLSLLLLLRMADIGSYFAFNRRFSPLLELHLLADGWNLASTSIGPAQAAAVSLLALASLVLLTWWLYRCLHNIANINGSTRKRVLILAAGAALIGLAGLASEKHYGYDGPLQAKIVPEYYSRIEAIAKSIKDQQQFTIDLQSDSVLDTQQPAFSALSGKDVLLIFVESYGRGYIDAERFSTHAASRLNAVQNLISNAGLSARSGWLTSPIRGGRSWLAHSTLQSGLKIDNQARYDRLVTSDRTPLSTLFTHAGWRSVGIMPAIQQAWPEGSWYGYQDIHTSTDLGYAGERFGYVTMPDQYTLHHFEHHIRHQTDTPVMATMALLSTHAPWTPLPLKLDWNMINDGRGYDGSNRYGEPISWKFRSKVQDMYIQSLDYTLDVLGEYAALYADDALIIILGDHQPAPIINGWGKSGDVPVHIISRDPQILDRLAPRNWSEGMLQQENLQSIPMQAFRKILSTIFESPTAGD